MIDKKTDDKILTDIDEAEAAIYRQIFGIFDNDNGDFIKIDVKENAKGKDIQGKGRTISRDENTGELHASLRGKPVEEWNEQEKLQYTVETDLQLHGSIQQDTLSLLDQEGYYFSGGQVHKNEKANQNAQIENEVDRIIRKLSEKEISSMAVLIKINGTVKEYVNDQKAGEKYLSKEDQIEKIKETVKGFRNIVIVHSEEELQKLQEDFIKKQEKAKAAENKSKEEVKNTDSKMTPEPEVKTQVYIRISEKDYETVKAIIEKENIRIAANKVKTRDDKSGMNLVIRASDADKVRNILNQNDIPILQDVDGNIDWDDIKTRSNKFENVTVEQLRDFQNKNKDKYDYVAFRKDNSYTVFTDKNCDIGIGSSERKTVKQLEDKVQNYRKNNPAKAEQKIENKSKNMKEAAR